MASMRQSLHVYNFFIIKYYRLKKNYSRRIAFKKMAAAAAIAIAGEGLINRISGAETILDDQLKGKVNHSVCRWCYNTIPLEDLCKAAKKIGLTSIELVGPDEWPVLK